MSPRYLPDFQKSLRAVLAIDPTLKNIVDEHTFHAFLDPVPESRSSFEYLVRNILSQQVSGAAGTAILRRFVTLTALPGDSFPTPSQLLNFPVEQLRTAGLSMRKAEYVRGLAEAYRDDVLSDEMLLSMEDDDVVDKLVSIRGLGPWTAQMFLIFFLHRLDTFSVGDVGVQRGIRRYLKDRPALLQELKTQAVAAPPSPGTTKKARAAPPLPADLKDMELIAARFSPHRTAFQLILWKLSDIQMNTIEAREAVAEANRAIASKRRKKM